MPWSCVVAVLDLLLLVEPCEDSRRLLALSGELLAPVPGLVPRGASLSSVLQEAVGDLCVISLGWGLNSMGGAGPWGCNDCGPAPVCSGCPWPSG